MWCCGCRWIHEGTYDVHFLCLSTHCRVQPPRRVCLMNPMVADCIRIEAGQCEGRRNHEYGSEQRRRKQLRVR